VLRAFIPGEVVAELRHYQDIGSVGPGTIYHSQAGIQVGAHVVANGKLGD
jgi:hypothetical protein